MSKIIGIDLGTTNSCVAVMEAGEPAVVLTEEGNRTTPSVVAFAKDEERLVGTSAKRQAVTNPTKTVSSVKRFIGRQFNEMSAEIKESSYTVKRNPSGGIKIVIDDKDYTPEQISASILQKLKKIAEQHLGKPSRKLS